MRTKGKLIFCDCGKCGSVSIEGSHPIGEIYYGECGDSWPAMKIVGPCLDQKVVAYMDTLPYYNIPKEEGFDNAKHWVDCWNAVESIGGDPETIRGLVAVLDDLVQAHVVRMRPASINLRVGIAQTLLAKIKVTP